MNLEERIDLHRRMAEGYHEAYKQLQLVGKAVYPEEWKFAPDAEYFSVYFSGGKSAPIGEQMAGDAVTEWVSREAKVYSAALPDWGPVSFMCFPAEAGFTTRTLYGGHTKDGVWMQFHMIDFVHTNEEGLITRWETFCDGEEFGPVAELAVGVRGPFDDFSVYWAALDRRLEALEAA